MNWIFIFEVIVLSGVGLILIYLAKLITKGSFSEIGMLGLIVLPFLMFGFLSGKISEFSGFGITAKVEKTKKLPVTSLNIPADSIKISNVTSNDTDYYRKAFFEMCSEYLIINSDEIPSSGSESDYYVASVSYAIRSSIACGKFAGLIILDGSNRYIGSFESQFFIESTSIWAVPNSSKTITAKDLAYRINTSTIFGASLTHPEARVPKEGNSIALNINSSIQDAFNEFRNEDISFLVLTDSLGKFQGIVRYKDVINSIISATLSE